MKWIAKIQNKTLKFSEHTRKSFIDYMSEHDLTDLDITPRKEKQTVSESLRGFYWGAWLIFIKNIDDNFKTYSVDDLHDFLKFEFNGTDVYNPISKTETRIAKSIMSGTVKTSDAFIYMEKIRRWVAENYGEEMPDASEFNALRDKHFDVEPMSVIDYPTEEFDPEF